MLENNRDLFNDQFPLRTERQTVLIDFTRNLSIRFHDLSLLDMAFHHRSYSHEHSNLRYNNERLEFLGDTVLGLIVASYLYESMSERDEGDLSKIKSVIVSEQTLSQIALEIGVDRTLILGRGEELSGGRQKKAILADALEAVIGAYYLDSGYHAATKLVRKLIASEIWRVRKNRYQQDYKTLLQEFGQKQFKECPSYELINQAGPDHDRMFWISVTLNGTTYGSGMGKNKKEAEQAAAEQAYHALQYAGKLN